MVSSLQASGSDITFSQRVVIAKIVVGSKSSFVLKCQINSKYDKYPADHQLKMQTTKIVTVQNIMAKLSY